MSATVGAALKKIGVALLGDKETWKKAACAIIAALCVVFMPNMAVSAVFQQMEVDGGSAEVQQTVIKARSGRSRTGPITAAGNARRKAIFRTSGKWQKFGQKIPPSAGFLPEIRNWPEVWPF